MRGEYIHCRLGAPAKETAVVFKQLATQLELQLIAHRCKLRFFANIVDFESEIFGVFNGKTTLPDIELRLHVQILEVIIQIQGISKPYQWVLSGELLAVSSLQ